jgi:hypothetical protein
MLGFDFCFEFKLGAYNVVADALSHRNYDHGAAIMALTTPSFQLFDDIQQEFTTEPELRQLEEVVAESCHDTWGITDDLVMIKGHVYLALSSPSLIVTLQHAHGTGHEGAEKTLNLFRADFHVPGDRMVV